MLSKMIPLVYIILYCLQLQTSSACKTSTYEISYLMGATRVWNSFPGDLSINEKTTVKSFGKKFFNYYKTAVEKCYDIHDPRTWKSICVKCNQALT